MCNENNIQKIFLTGATGYVGGRLAPRLLEEGYYVRCAVRSMRKYSSRPWSKEPGVEAVKVDLLDTKMLTRAMHDCDAAFYLIHSMQVTGSEYAEYDRQLAASFAEAAEEAGVKQIIYLGGLGELGDDLSEHLSSRREMEAILASRKTPVTVMRAAMIIGSGSASFEILRYLVERLPVMITPSWVKTECQPISIRNVIEYLVLCLRTPETKGETLDIGGPDILTYRELIDIMAEELFLPKRLIKSEPLLTPRLSSAWIHLVTPISYRLARPLAEGLRNRVVCRNDRAVQLMPQELIPVRTAIDGALGRIMRDDVQTAWSDAGPVPGDPDWAGGTVFIDKRRVKIDASPDDVFEAVCRVGGGHGYYAGDWLWKIRGAMDRVMGGPGLRRGRRHSRQLSFGDALDFWRVMESEKPKRLSLRAEMIVPGEALLEFRIKKNSKSKNNSVTLFQIARFKPRGLTGLLYWYAVLPFHAFIFRGMIEGIRKAAQEK